VFPPAIASKDDWEWNQFLSILHLSRWFETTCLVAVVAYWGDKIILQKKRAKNGIPREYRGSVNWGAPPLSAGLTLG
jgi:hypothetical protein